MPIVRRHKKLQGLPCTLGSLFSWAWLAVPLVCILHCPDDLCTEISVQRQLNHALIQFATETKSCLKWDAHISGHLLAHSRIDIQCIAALCLY